MTTINIDILAVYTYEEVSPGVEGLSLAFMAADPRYRDLATPYGPTVSFGGTLGNTADHASGIFTSASDMINYYAPTATPYVINSINTNDTANTYVAGNVVLVDSYVSGAISSAVSSLATVASSGSYNDLTSKPSIPAAQVQTDWNASSGLGVLLNKPSIPSAQVNSDWTAASGVAQVLNKPKSYVLNSGTAPTLRTSPIEVTGSGTTNGSGQLVIYLTVDGTSTGTGLCTTGIDAVNIQLNSTSSAIYGAGYVLSNSNKTLTITVVQVAILGLSVVSSGVGVNVWIKGY